MNTLHLLNNSPFTDHQFANMLLFAEKEDGVLLTGDASYALQADSAPYQALQDSRLSIFVLEEDIVARAIQNSLENVKIIDYQAFVELCTYYTKVMSWL